MRTIAIASILLIAGCAMKIPYYIDPTYKERMPERIAVAVVGKGGREAVERIVSERLRQKGYIPVVRRDKGPEDLLERGLEEDAIMVVEIEEWGRKGRLFYLTYEVGLRFVMYSRDGEVLWRSHNSISHRTVDIEGDKVRLARYRPFEPYVERVVGISFSTLPDRR